MSEEGRDHVGRRSPAGAEQADGGAPLSEVEYVHVKRTPRYGRFMIAGCLVFAVIALVSSFAYPAAGEDRNAVFGFLLVVGLFLGVLVGGVAALVAERLSRRRLVRAQRTRSD